MAAEVPELLEDQAETYRQRGEVYGKNYLEYGAILQALFPQGVTLSTADDHNRFGLLTQMISKLTRYTNAFRRGEGHDDSLADLAVYTTMLREVDQMIKENGNEPEENQ